MKRVFVSKSVEACALEGAQAAGRDIHNHHTTLVQQEAREWQLQAEFAERTGIWCPKPAREWLEHLLVHHGFTVKQLARSWRNNSIGWSARSNTYCINAPRLEGTFLSALSLFCLYAVIEALVKFYTNTESGWLWDGVEALLQIASSMVLFTVMVGPLLQSRRTALAVRRACKQGMIDTSTPGNNEGETHDQNLS